MQLEWQFFVFLEPQKLTPMGNDEAATASKSEKALSPVQV